MDDLAERVATFPRWHYQFDLGEVTTPVPDPRVINRHWQREAYLVEPLEVLGLIAGARVLDLGCNAGYWSLQMINHGAAFVHGVDGRQMHIDQANLVFEASSVPPERYHFERGNVFEWDTAGTFDIVLCLGLLYHVAKPFDLLERCARWSSNVLLVETAICTSPGVVLEGHLDSRDDFRHAVDYDLVFFPSRDAVSLMLHQVGFNETAILKPSFSDWTGAEDFRDGTRRAFLATKQTSLTEVSERVEQRLP